MQCLGGAGVKGTAITTKVNYNSKHVQQISLHPLPLSGSARGFNSSKESFFLFFFSKECFTIHLMVSTSSSFARSQILAGIAKNGVGLPKGKQKNRREAWACWNFWNWIQVLIFSSCVVCKNMHNVLHKQHLSELLFFRRIEVQAVKTLPADLFQSQFCMGERG